IGQLPIPPEFLKPGLGVQIELLATRTFSNYQASQKLWVTDIISKSRSVPGSVNVPSVPSVPIAPGNPTFPNNVPPLPNNPVLTVPGNQPSLPTNSPALPFPGTRPLVP
ncbi:MAG: hypothetical protein ACRC6M_08155, partial [Microcystaceae cyanobacterium]